MKKDENSIYHRLITAFHKLTGVPMILNTSFNGKNQPIVEDPEDALKTFQSSGKAFFFDQSIQLVSMTHHYIFPLPISVVYHCNLSLLTYHNDPSL